MLICVTGATGLIGKQICIQLLNLNFKVIAPVRQIRQFSIKHNNLKYVEIGDFRRKINWAPALQKVKCVIHCAAKNNLLNNEKNDSPEYNLINIKATRNLASQAANLGVKRFIFLSSIKVNGDKRIILNLNITIPPILKTVMEFLNGKQKKFYGRFLQIQGCKLWLLDHL
jgi:nucleoside-diphosphate-sugar epimerase